MNVLLIDSNVTDYHIIVESCNANTLPFVYSYHSTRDEISKFFSYISHNINRIGIFADQNAKLFLDNERFFVENENTLILSDNSNFMIQLINGYDISYIDYFACNTLNDPKWVKYYEILMSLTNVIVGASNNETGNIQYGGDWIMENTCENIESIYFSKNIQYYTYLLGYATNFFVGTGTPSKDITDFFKNVATGGGGGAGKYITDNYNEDLGTYGSGFRYKTDSDIYSDMIEKLDIATAVADLSTIPPATGDRLTNFNVLYSGIYYDIGQLINLPDPPVSTITFSGASDISGVVGTNTISSYSDANQIDSSGTLYTFYNNGNSLTNTTGSFTLNTGSMNCYVLLIGPGGSGADSSRKPGAGGGGILAYFTMIKGVTYNIVINSGTFNSSVGVAGAGKSSIISNESIKTVNLVAKGSNTNSSKSGGVPTVSGTAMSITNYKIYNGADATDTTGKVGNVPISTDISPSTFSTIFVDMMNLIGNQNVAYSSMAVPLGSFNYGFGSSGCSHKKVGYKYYPGLGGIYDKGGVYSTSYTENAYISIRGGNGKGYGNGGGQGSFTVGTGGDGGKGAIFIYLNKDS